jgi:thioesterase domain-containing protein
MSAMEACNNNDNRGFVLDAATGSSEAEPNTHPRRQMQNGTMNATSRSTDEARAAVWAGILGAAKHIGNRAPGPMRLRPDVVQLRQGTAAAAVYFIGAGLYELHVAQLMPSDHSIYAVETTWPAAWHDAAAKNAIDATPILEDMVGPYVAALGAHLGTHLGAAPCVLVGYSFHASMAFEIAHQLLARGRQVALVMLLDAPAEYPKPHKVMWNNLRDVWTKPRHSIELRLATSFAIVRWALGVTTRFVQRRFAESALNDPGELTTKLDSLGRPMHWPLIERLYDNSLRSYTLRRLDCRGVLFRADRSEDCPAATADVSLGWAGLFGRGFEIVQATGDHFTMMREPPHDQALARQMSQTLDRYCAEPAREAQAVAAS